MVAAALTDADGKYQLNNLNAGTYQIVVGDERTPGVARSTITLSVSQQAVVRDFTLDLAGVISGRVFDSNGTTPVREARVVLVRDGNEVISMRTGTGGEYVFDVLFAGNYSLEVLDGNQQYPLIAGINIGGGAVLSNRDFVAGNESLAGIVRRATTNQPVVNATLFLESGDPLRQHSQIISQSNDSDGTFRINDLIPGNYTILAYAGHQSLVLPDILVGAGTEFRDVALPSSSTLVRGTVQDAAGPISNAIVVITDQAGRVLGTSSADGSGAFQIDSLPPGNYEAIATAPGFAPSLGTTFVLANNGSVNGLAIPVVPAAVSDIELQFGSTNPRTNILDGVPPSVGYVMSRRENELLGTRIEDIDCDKIRSAARRAFDKADDLLGKLQEHWSKFTEARAMFIADSFDREEKLISFVTLVQGVAQVFSLVLSPKIPIERIEALELIGLVSKGTSKFFDNFEEITNDVKNIRDHLQNLTDPSGTACSQAILSLERLEIQIAFINAAIVKVSSADQHALNEATSNLQDNEPALALLTQVPINDIRADIQFSSLSERFAKFSMRLGKSSLNEIASISSSLFARRNYDLALEVQLNLRKEYKKAVIEAKTAFDNFYDPELQRITCMCNPKPGRGEGEFPVSYSFAVCQLTPPRAPSEQITSRATMQTAQ